MSVTMLIHEGDASFEKMEALGRQHGFSAIRREGRLPDCRGRYPSLCIMVDNEDLFMRDGQFDDDAWHHHQWRFYGRRGPHGKGDLRRVLRRLQQTFDVRVER